jgi:hypothetical protein
MPSYTRNRKRWTVNECLDLQREFELLEWTIDEIAEKHKRTPNAIMNKLGKEGFADYNVLSNEYYKLNFGKNSFTEENADVTVTNVNTNVNTNENVNTIKNDNTNENSYDYHELKNHIEQLEKQLSSLTQMIMKQNKNSKTVLSLFE